MRTRRSFALRAQDDRGGAHHDTGRPDGRRLTGTQRTSEAALVALPEETLCADREPSPDGYREIRIFRRGDTVAPLVFPEAAMAVSDLLG